MSSEPTHTCDVSGCDDAAVARLSPPSDESAGELRCRDCLEWDVEYEVTE